MGRFLEIFSGRNFLEKVSPRTPLQKLSNETDRQSWVQIRNTKLAVQCTEVKVFQICTYKRQHNRGKFFVKGVVPKSELQGKPFSQKGFPEKL